MTRPEYETSPDEAYIRDALKRGVASIRDVPMKALGRPDTKYQARIKHLDRDHVERLTFILDEQGAVGPVVVFSAGDRLILADGFHRHEVHRLKQLPTIRAYVIAVPADRLEHEAMLFASMCNRTLSLGRTPQDLRKAVEMMLSDPDCWTWTDRRIGNHCGVSGQTVKMYRAKYAQERNLELPKVVTRSDGQAREYSRPNKEAPNLRVRKRRGKVAGYMCRKKGKAVYLGQSKEQAESAVRAMAAEAETARRNLDCTSLSHFFSARGHAVETFDLAPKSHPGLTGFRGLGCIATSTDFAGYLSVVSAIGCLRMLRLLDGTPDARMVVVCYKEDGPQPLIELAERDGIEFLTPEELANSLTLTKVG